MKKEALFFQALVKEYKAQGDLLKLLPQSFRQTVQDNPLSEISLKNFLGNPLERFHSIHYSWFLKELPKFSSFEKGFALSLLQEELKSKIKKTLPFQETPPPFFIKELLINKWSSFLFPKELLPMECLPENQWFFLLKLPKNEIIKIINYLGLFELADLFKRVVDKKLIASFFSFLTNEEKLFLKQCMQQREVFRLKDKVIETLIKKGMSSEKILRDELHKQGLIHLGLILSKMEPDFIWYLTHKLDTGRAKIILDYTTKKITDPVRKALIDQFFFIVNTLKIEVQDGH
jgi:hypothetical protein